MTHNENLISIGAILIFSTLSESLPEIRFIAGVLTSLWLLFQLYRGFEKRGEEKKKRKEEAQKRQEEIQKRQEEIQKRKEEREEHKMIMESTG